MLYQLTQQEGFTQLVNTMKAEVNRRQRSAKSINWDSTADQFLAFEKKSLYAAGYLQGAEFGVNVLEAIPQEYVQLKADIEALAKQIKTGGRR